MHMISIDEMSWDEYCEFINRDIEFGEACDSVPEKRDSGDLCCGTGCMECLGLSW